jgi:hypothetical protein
VCQEFRVDAGFEGDEQRKVNSLEQQQCSTKKDMRWLPYVALFAFIREFSVHGQMPKNN